MDLVSLLPLVLIILVFWMFIIRPARVRQRALTDVQDALRPGMRVMTGAGLIATVAGVEDGEVLLEISPGVNARYARQAVVRVLDPLDGAGADEGPEAFGGPDGDDGPDSPGSSGAGR